MNPATIKDLSDKLDASCRKRLVVTVRHDGHEAWFRPATIGEMIAVDQFIHTIQTAWPIGVEYGLIGNGTSGLLICAVDVDGTTQTRPICETCANMGAWLINDQYRMMWQESVEQSELELMSGLFKKQST